MHGSLVVQHHHLRNRRWLRRCAPLHAQFWRIVDCTDDFAWGLFHYAGAASAAGQSYSGAVLVSRDGSWPAEVRAT